MNSRIPPLPGLLISAALAALSWSGVTPVAAADRIPIKVIVLSGFEIGDDTGDAPGEFQFWVEREHLTGTLEVTGAPHPLRYNDAGLYASVAGNTRDTALTTAPMSELVMALCLDPRLDLRKTYWLINGLSGIDPAAGSIGSAVWAANVVDADAMREVDEAEMPPGWPYGLLAIGSPAPNTLPPSVLASGRKGGALPRDYTMNYALNANLARWACHWSSLHATLPDEPALKAWRDKYTGYPQAQLPPQVLMGAALSTARYWHGEKRTEWARDWVRLWTNGQDAFSTTAMEPAAYVGTLRRMAAKGLVDFNRVMMLRGASNYCMPPPGQGVTSTIGDESVGTLPGLEANYRAGSVIVHELLSNWPQYENRVPGS
jgi:purine nucleoside permease